MTYDECIKHPEAEFKTESVDPDGLYRRVCILNGERFYSTIMETKDYQMNKKRRKWVRESRGGRTRDLE